MNNLDPVSLIALLLAAIGSGHMADVLGPYAVIVILASTGAGWSLGETKGLSHLESVKYFILIVMTAIFTTYYIAIGIVAFTGTMFVAAGSEGTPVTWLMGGIALGIGLVGTRWKKVGNLLFKRVVKFFQGPQT